jgi:hypothetical protein
MQTPYESLPPKAFWKTSVADRNMFDVTNLWDPKFKLNRGHKVVTFGSCFAQHIGNAMQQRGFDWISTEHPPNGLNEENRKNYNYNIFSARTGNIYTTTLLEQWTNWALGKKEIPREVWQKGDRFYDPFRPRIEPNGFESPEELRKSLQQTVLSFKDAILKANFFVFTLGLTESWVNAETGYEYPMCPGTVAGEFNDKKHKFVNLQYNQVLNALKNSMILMRSVNPKLRFILTVSPVPLTATNSNQHVLVATMASKSILRAVCSSISSNRAYVDYFPSYEIINSPTFKGSFFEPNLRSVNPYGVNFVMDSFFQCLVDKFGPYKRQQKNMKRKNTKNAPDTICEEELLEAFGK